MNEDENAYKYGPLYVGESTGFHRHMISVVALSYSETLVSMLVEYATTKMGFLVDYLDDDTNHKSIRGNCITTFLLHVTQCIIFNLKNRVKTILIADASLKSFYSRLGFKVIKDYETSTIFEKACRQFNYETGKFKADQKKTISLQCLHTIPRCVTFIHDNRIKFNIHKNVFINLDFDSTSETWFPNKYIDV